MGGHQCLPHWPEGSRIPGGGHQPAAALGHDTGARRGVQWGAVGCARVRDRALEVGAGVSTPAAGLLTALPHLRNRHLCCSGSLRLGPGQTWDTCVSATRPQPTRKALPSQPSLPISVAAPCAAVHVVCGECRRWTGHGQQHLCWATSARVCPTQLWRWQTQQPLYLWQVSSRGRLPLAQFAPACASGCHGWQQLQPDARAGVHSMRMQPGIDCGGVSGRGEGQLQLASPTAELHSRQCVLTTLRASWAGVLICCRRRIFPVPLRFCGELQHLSGCGAHHV